MTEHLPECWAKHDSDPPAWCICDELRACEQRLLKEYRQQHDGISERYFRQIRDDALLEAREAVANTPMRTGAYNTKAADLAAIDALKEKP